MAGVQIIEEEQDDPDVLELGSEALDDPSVLELGGEALYLFCKLALALRLHRMSHLLRVVTLLYLIWSRDRQKSPRKTSCGMECGSECGGLCFSATGSSCTRAGLADKRLPESLQAAKTSACRDLQASGAGWCDR